MLWLRRQPEESAPAIFKEFAACGSQGARLIFADYVFDERQHMHRIAHAQLSLDTPEYNGHTTGNDMLWAAVTDARSDTSATVVFRHRQRVVRRCWG